MKKEIFEKNIKLIQDTADIVSKDLEVFYNPKMELNRTMSVLVLEALNKKDMQIALPLAGSGVRAIRFLSELPEKLIKTIEVNDHNPKTKKLFKKNLKLNKLDENKIITHNKDANEFLNQSQGFDYIDIDPFGSPNFLLDSSVARLSRGGILAVTATDTAALAGTYPNTCKFKYWSESALCPQKHEMGIRILIRKVQLIGMQNEKALIPIFSYHDEHYYRIFFLCEKGKKKSANLFDKTNSFFTYCPKCSFSSANNQRNKICPECDNELRICGALFSGEIQNNDFLKKMIKKTKNEKEISFLTKILEDNKVPILGSFDTHDICSKQNFTVEKIQVYLDRLEKKGFKACRSLFPITSIRTNANFKEMKQVFRK